MVFNKPRNGKSFVTLRLRKRVLYIYFGLIMCSSIFYFVPFSRSSKISSASNELLNSYEHRQLSYQPRQPRISCTDSLLAANPLRSVIYKQGKSTVYLGENVCFKVELYNGYGKAMLTGGDHLRARLLNHTVGAYTPGTILDHDNGTYTVTFQVLWTGWAQLEVELLYTKETLAAAIRIRRTWDYSDIRAIFSYMNRTEKTKCSPEYEKALKYSSTSEVCNFSYWNKSIKWYCAKPNNNMSCNNWVSVYRNHENYTKSINKCEDELSIRRKITFIPSNITLRILNNSTNGSTFVVTDIACSGVNTTELWFKTNPTGYFYNNKWIFMHCKGIASVDPECMRNKTIMLWGDSTLYQWYKYFKSTLDNMSTSVCKVLISDEMFWLQTITCFYQKYNITLSFLGHNIPVSPFNMTNLSILFKFNLFEKIINGRTTDDIILVIHMYAHIQQYNFIFFTKNIFEVKRCLKRILERNIKVKVFIKLPHTYRRYKDNKWMLTRNDYIGYIYTDIMRKVFEGLYNKIIVLDQMDATIAKRSVDLHPGMEIVKGMVHQMMSYVCKNIS